jgi:hypothetical protein
MRVMQSKISKSLEAIIKETTLRLKQDNTTTSYIDRLIIETLTEEGHFATWLLKELIGDSGTRVVTRRVAQSIIHSPIIETAPPEARFTHMCTTLSKVLSPKRISTAHALFYAASDSTTATSHELRGYGIKSEDILHAIGSVVEWKIRPALEELVIISRDIKPS